MTTRVDRPPMVQFVGGFIVTALMSPSSFWAPAAIGSGSKGGFVARSRVRCL